MSDRNDTNDKLVTEDKEVNSSGSMFGSMESQDDLKHFFGNLFGTGMNCQNDDNIPVVG